jgi:hypothetical protein
MAHSLSMSAQARRSRSPRIGYAAIRAGGAGKNLRGQPFDGLRTAPMIQILLSSRFNLGF